MSTVTQPQWAWNQVSDKVRRRIVQSGERLMVVEVQFTAPCDLPVHKHPHEQILYCLRGEVILTVDGVEHRIPAGGSMLLPGNVPHGARFEIDSTVLDVFSPPREDFLATDQRIDPVAGNG